MGQIANQMAIEMIMKIRDKLRQRKEEKRTATTKKKSSSQNSKSKR